MKFSISQEKLQKILQDLKRVIPSKPQLPILKAVLISCSTKATTFSATDLFTGIKSTTLCNIIEEGSIAVPLQPFLEIVSTFSPGQIKLEVKDQKLNILGENTKTSLQCFSSEEYPTFPEKSGETVTLKADVFQQIVKNMLMSCAKDDSRPVLTAVLFSFTEENLRVVSTDGFRLGVMETTDTATPQELLIPAKALQEISRLQSRKNNDKISFTVSSELKQVFCSFGETELIIRLMEGEFPPYQKIMPEDFKIKISVDAEKLSQAIKGAMVFARETSNIIKFEVQETEVVVKASSPTLGEHQSTVPLEKITPGEALIAFNAQYILDFIQATKPENIIMGINESLQPAVFQPENEPNYKYIVMPFKVS